MPEIDGLELAARAPAGSTVPIVILSSIGAAIGRARLSRRGSPSPWPSALHDALATVLFGDRQPKARRRRAG
jgi:hypothetical protein